MARTYTRVLGMQGILEQMRQGAELYRVAGKFGGWGITKTTCDKCVTVRADSCHNLVSKGLIVEDYRRPNFVQYKLRDKEI